jgi:flagella synthesis protein FlgN
MTQEQGFAELCRAEAEQVARLIELLQQEQQVMIAGQVHLLEDLADSKSKVLDELAMHSQNPRPADEVAGPVRQRYRLYLAG